MFISRRFLPALAAAGLLVTGLAACGDDDSTDVFSLEVGDCFDDDGLTGEISSVPTVDCDEPHDNEVFAIYEIPGDDLPDNAEMETIAQEQCLGQPFEDFVGVPFDESDIYAAPLTPTSDSWDAGDNELVCLAYELEGGTTGSLEGVNR